MCLLCAIISSVSAGVTVNHLKCLEMYLFCLSCKASESVGCEIYAGAIHLLLISRARCVISLTVNIFIGILKPVLNYIWYEFLRYSVNDKNI